MSFCRRLIARSGLQDGAPLEEDDIMDIGEAVPPATDVTGPVNEHRAYHFLVQTLVSEHGEDILPHTNTRAEPLIRKVAAWLYARFRTEFDQLQDTVRSTKIEDPIRLPDEGLREAAEPQRPYLNPLGHDTLSWLAQDGDPELIREWKSRILEQLETPGNA